jgi:hypothetical protein
MNNTPDTAAADNGGSFDPTQAAALLGETTQDARRRLEPYPPWMTVIRAVTVLIGCGAVWLSVRGQHPYRGPTVAVGIPVVAAFVLINFAATMAVARRATVGVSGKSRLHPAEIAIMSVVWIGVFVVLAVLAGSGVSRSVVYGLYPTTVPLIAAGLAWAGIMAVRSNWRACGIGLAVAAIGAIGLLAGPAGAWAVAGVGICVLLLGRAAVIASRQRRTAVQP